MSTPKNLFSSSTFFVLALIASVSMADKPWEPIPRSEPEWMAQHESFVNNSKVNSNNINCVFIGSSSIEYLATTGKDIWNEKYIPIGSVNYGIGGDRSQHVLWRIQNGELDRLNPKLVVVYAGSNNIIDNCTIEEIIRGATAVITEIKTKLPKTKILYMEFFPRGGKDIENRWNRIAAVNSEMQKLNDGKNIKTLNIFWDLAKAWLVIKDELYKKDLFHLSKKGYAQWDASWSSTFWNLWAQP